MVVAGQARVVCGVWQGGTAVAVWDVLAGVSPGLPLTPPGHCPRLPLELPGLHREYCCPHASASTRCFCLHTLLLPPHTASASTHCFCLHTLLPPPHPRQRDHSLLGFMKGRWSLSLPGLLEHGFCPHRETMACWVL